MQHHPIGELHLLLVPDFQWDVISIDFVMELSESSRYNVVMTVVDSMSKQAYFILIHITVTAKGIVLW